MGLLEKYQFWGVRWLYHDKVSKTEFWEELPKKENYGEKFERFRGKCYRTWFHGTRVSQFKATWTEQRIVKQTRSQAWDLSSHILNSMGAAATGYSLGAVFAGEALFLPTAGKEIAANTGGVLFDKWLGEQGWETQSDTNRISNYQVEFLGRTSKTDGGWNKEEVDDCLCN